jgi:phenylalanyl-tRNA synthetase beta chain
VDHRVRFESAGDSSPYLAALHPGRSLALWMGDVYLGHLGELHPEQVQRLDLPVVPYIFEINLSACPTKTLPAYVPVSKYPAIHRDIALVLSESVTAASIQVKIKELASQLLTEVCVFDLYRGQGVPSGCKSIALRLAFQDPSRTLQDEEIVALMENITTGLTASFGATLRAG